MVNESEFIKDLTATKILSSAEINKFYKEAQAKNMLFFDYLLEEKLIKEEEAFGKIAKIKGVPFVDLATETIRKDILQIVPEPIAQSHSVVAFDKKGDTFRVATLDPTDLQTFAFLEKKIEAPLEIYYTTPSSIANVLKQYHRSLRAEFEKITKQEGGEGEDDEKLKEMAEDLPIVRVVDTLLEYAIFEGASDIHIEPGEKEVAIRYRVDGVLREVMTLPRKVHPGLIARIKILSNLKLDEHRLPQDGRFKIETEDYKISFRVSVIPIFDGEKIVMRLLNESNKILTLEQLGFQDSALAAIRRNIEKPNGMVLVTGPTGSGKTTTLYTVLNMLNKPGVNITTIEDPIEYRMAGVNQSQVNPKIGYTFAAGLRAFLRQDPNIIMVGEIRDTETADIAINAAMTGHLVLATLHTNDAATALPRLQDMKIASFLIASTVNIIVAQRLVRRICPNCIQKYKLPADIIKELEESFDLKNIMEIYKKNNLVKGSIGWRDLEFYKGKGCNQCKDGYKGRMGIYEVLEVTPVIGDLVLKDSSSEVIMKKAKEQGMITMLEDGFIKAKNGITTIDEIVRVTKE